MKDSQKVEVLKQILLDTIWMARRYADGRRTFSPSIVNRAIDRLEAIGIKITPDTIIPDPRGRYATDGDYGRWMPELQRFEKP